MGHPLAFATLHENQDRGAYPKSYLLIFKSNGRSSTIPFQATDDDTARRRAADILFENDALSGELTTPDQKNPKELHSLGIVSSSKGGAEEKRSGRGEEQNSIDV